MALSPEEAAALGLDAPAPRKALSAQEAATLGLDAPEPSFFKKAAKYVGETGADIATNYATLGGAVNPLVAGVDALGSYLQPDTKTGGGGLGDRYQRAMRNLRGREEEAQTRSPTTAPAATLAGFLALPVSGAAMSPTSTFAQAVPRGMTAAIEPAAISTARSLPAAAVKILAGTNDAAVVNAFTKGFANADSPEAFSKGFDEGLNDPTKYAAGVLGPIAQEVGPRAIVAAQRAEDRASQAASRLYRTGPDSTKIMEQRLGQSLHDPLAAQTLAGEAIRSRPDLIQKPLNERAGAAGALKESSSRVIAKIRELAEPRALVEYKPYFARLRAIRDELVGSAAAQTSPEGQAAAKYIDDLILAREAEFTSKLRETGQEVTFEPGQAEIGMGSTVHEVPGQPGLRAGVPKKVVGESHEAVAATSVTPRAPGIENEAMVWTGNMITDPKTGAVTKEMVPSQMGRVGEPGYRRPAFRATTRKGQSAVDRPASRPIYGADDTPRVGETLASQTGRQNPLARTMRQLREGGPTEVPTDRSEPGFNTRPNREQLELYQQQNRPNEELRGPNGEVVQEAPPFTTNLEHAPAVPHPGTPEVSTQGNLFPGDFSGEGLARGPRPVYPEGHPMAGEPIPFATTEGPAQGPWLAPEGPPLKTVPGKMIREEKGLPLSEWTGLKSWDQDTAFTTSSGAPRAEETIDQSLKLEFLKRAGGAAREAEEAAITGAFQPIAPGAKISRGVSGTSWQPERPLGKSISIGEPDKFSGIRPADRTPLARAREAVEKTLAFKQGKADFSVAETLLPNAQELQRMAPEQLRDLERSYSPRGAFWHWVFKKIAPSDPNLVKMNELLAKGMRTGAKGDYQAVVDRQAIMAIVQRLRSEAKEREDAP